MRNGCVSATIVHVPSATAPDVKEREASPELRETAARLGAFLRHIFIFSGGQHLRKMEESGLTLTQFKTLLMLAGPEGEEPYAGRDIAERLEISLPSVSRAVDELVRGRLVSRVEDPEDRRVRGPATPRQRRGPARVMGGAPAAGTQGASGGPTPTP